MISYDWIQPQEGSLEIIDQLVTLFVENTTTDYITHIEIKEGRAENQTTWSKDLKQVLWTELYAQAKGGNVLVATKDNKPIGFALVKWKKNKITIEDIISTSKGVGSEMIRTIEEKAKQDRLTHYKYSMADVGPNNQRAQKFMERNGYKPITIVYRKELDSLSVKKWVGNPQIQAEKPLESKMKLMQEIAQKNTSLLVGPLTETQVEAIKAIISMSLIEYDAYLRAKILR